MEHYSAIQPGASSMNLAMDASGMATGQLAHEIPDQQMVATLGSSALPTTRYMNQRDKVLMYQLGQYYMTKVATRSKNIAKSIQEVVKIVHDVLRELEIQEPRFISTFTEVNGHYEGRQTVVWLKSTSIQSIDSPSSTNHASHHSTYRPSCCLLYGV